MAVAALSTSAIALTAGSVPQTAAPQGAQPPLAFALLVAQAKSGEKGGSESTGAETGSEGEGEPTGVVDDMLSTVTTDETREAIADQPVNLLAEIEAMVAAAAQVTVTQPAPVQPVAITPPPAPAAEPSVAPSLTAPRTAAVIITVPSPAARATVAPPVLSPPIATTTDAAQPVAAADQAPVPTADATTPTAAPMARAAPAAPKSIPSDIASLLASLKAAFAPIDKTANGTGPVAPAIVAQAPVETSPLPVVEAVIATGTSVPAAAPPVPIALAESAIPVATTAAVETVAAAIVQPKDGAKSVTKAPAVPPTADAKPAPVVHATAEAPKSPPADSPAPQQDSAAADSIEASPSAATVAAAPPAPTIVPQALSQPTPATTPVDTAIAADPAAGINQADQVVTRHLDLARDNQWLDQLARDISQAANRDGHLKFQLNPEHLGALTVEIANSASGTAIRMTAENDQTRAIIVDAQPRLLAEVRAQGLRVSESHVDLNNQNNSGGYGSASANGQQGQPGQQRQSSSADHQPFVRTQATSRDDAADSAAHDESDLYA